MPSTSVAGGVEPLFGEIVAVMASPVYVASVGTVIVKKLLTSNSTTSLNNPEVPSVQPAAMYASFVPLGIYNIQSEEIPEKEPEFNETISLKDITAVRPLQPLNASDPMVVILLGMVMEVRVVMFLKALAPMLVTTLLLVGIVVALHPAIVFS